MSEVINETGGHPQTAPLSEATVGASQFGPEFVDCDGLKARWGIKRSLAYALLNDGEIQGVSLRRRGQKRGKRLFKVESVRAFLKKQAAQQESEVEVAA